MPANCGHTEMHFVCGWVYLSFFRYVVTKVRGNQNCSSATFEGHHSAPPVYQDLGSTWIVSSHNTEAMIKYSQGQALLRHWVKTWGLLTRNGKEKYLTLLLWLKQLLLWLVSCFSIDLEELLGADRLSVFMVYSFQNCLISRVHRKFHRSFSSGGSVGRQLWIFVLLFW